MLQQRKCLSRALSVPGHHTAKSRRKCLTQSTFLPETMPNIHRFKNCFTGRLWNKPYLIWLLKIPQQLKYVTTVPSNLMPSVLWRCWLGGRKGIRPAKTWMWGTGMVVCLERGAQTCIWPSWCHCHSLSLAPVKSRLILPFWYRLTWVVLNKGPLNGCVCVPSNL